MVGQFLWRAEVVALVPRQHVNRQRLRGVGPKRVFINVITTFVTRLVAQFLGYGDESAGFVVVVDDFDARAIGLGRAAFPGQGVAVPAIGGEVAAQLALFARLFVAVPLRAGFASV